MAAQLQDHIHLFLETTAPRSGETPDYHVVMPGMDEKPTIALSYRRGITGKLLVTQLADARGVPMVFRDRPFTIMVEDTHKDTLLGLAGCFCYYVPLTHDDAGNNLKIDAAGNAQGYPVLVVIDRAPHLDPMQQYWLVSVQLIENSITA
jgi:hypothetical protein